MDCTVLTQIADKMPKWQASQCMVIHNFLKKWNEAITQKCYALSLSNIPLDNQLKIGNVVAFELFGGYFEVDKLKGMDLDTTNVLSL